jgi:hypothetical protein
MVLSMLPCFSSQCTKERAALEVILNNTFKPCWFGQRNGLQNGNFYAVLERQQISIRRYKRLSEKTAPKKTLTRSSVNRLPLLWKERRGYRTPQTRSRQSHISAFWPDGICRVMIRSTQDRSVSGHQYQLGQNEVNSHF